MWTSATFSFSIHQLMLYLLSQEDHLASTATTSALRTLLSTLYTSYRGEDRWCKMYRICIALFPIPRPCRKPVNTKHGHVQVPRIIVMEVIPLSLLCSLLQEHCLRDQLNQSSFPTRLCSALAIKKHADIRYHQVRNQPEYTLMPQLAKSTCKSIIILWQCHVDDVIGRLLLQANSIECTSIGLDHWTGPVD